MAIVGIEVVTAIVVGLDIYRTAWTVDIYLPIYVKKMPAMIALLVFGRLVYIAVVLRPARPLTMFANEFRSSIFTVRRVVHALPALIAIPFFFGAFTTLKTAITFYNPFSWDIRLDLVDRWLHGGRAPWELLQPLLGTPVVTEALSTLYSSWFFVVALIWTWQAVSLSNPALRARFLATMLLVWMIFGTLLAVVFSSAGPCYFGRATGLADPYAPLAEYLHWVDGTHRIWALTVQDVLWSIHAASGIGLGGGISAMPSMHVAIALLIAIVLWHTNRVLGLLGIVYCIGIALGSVHLGWHYAIDSYVGALGTVLVWYLVGRAMAWRQTYAVRAGGFGPAGRFPAVGTLDSNRL